MTNNPYQQSDPIMRGLQAARLHQSIQGEAQDRDDRAEERERRHEREDFQFAGLKEAKAREQATQLSVEDERSLKEAQHTAALAEAKDKPNQVQHQQDKRAHETSEWEYNEYGRLSRDQLKTLNSLKIEGAKADVASKKESVAASRSQRELQASARDAASRVVTSMNRARDRFKVLSVPENADSIMNMAQAMNDRDPQALKAAWGPGFNVMADLLQDDVNRVVGQKTPDGDSIKEARLSDAAGPKLNDNGTPDDQSDDYVELWLDVTTDKGRRYTAPVTQNRSTSPDDPVLRLPMSEIENTLMAATEKALDIQEGRFTENSILEESRQQLALAGVDDKDIDNLLGGTEARSNKPTALVQNSEYLVQRAGFKNPREAVEFLNQSKHNPQESIIKLTSDMVKAQQDGMIKPGDDSYRNPEQMAEEAKRIVRAATSDTSSDTPPSDKGGDDSAPQFEEGKTYRDAQGNRARFIGGKWQPVE